MLDSGGMPSSHSATVSALAVAIGLQEGSGSPSFAIAVVLACIVCSHLTLLIITYRRPYVRARAHTHITNFHMA